jgi:hypothetical protein
MNQIEINNKIHAPDYASTSLHPKAEAVDGIRCMLLAMNTAFPDDEEVQLFGSTALAALALTPAFRPLLVEAKTISVLSGTLKRHREHSAIVHNALWCLSNMSELPATRPFMIKVGLMEATLDAMRLHDDDQFVNEFGALTLDHLTDTRPHRLQFLAAEGIEVIITGLCTFLSSERYQQYGVSVLMNLSGHPECKPQLVDLLAIPAIVVGMQKYENCLPLISTGCLALSNLTFENTANQVAVYEANGVDTILAAMHLHNGESIVQVQIFTVIANIAVVPEILEDIVREW